MTVLTMVEFYDKENGIFYASFFFFKAETGTKFKLGQGSKSGNV